MKLCSKCKIEKLESCFRRRSGRKDLESYCIECKKLVNVAAYKADPQEAYARKKQSQKILSDEINEIKAAHGCIICKEDDISCLDFHHVFAEEKEGNIALFVHNGSRAKALAEIGKCIVICANHHRKLHAGYITVGD